MQTIKTCAKLAAGSILFAPVMLGLAMAPGLLFDRDSTLQTRAQRMEPTR